MSLVAYERSFKADLLPYVVFKIILSQNGDIWVERWTKTFVLGCSATDSIAYLGCLLEVKLPPDHQPLAHAGTVLARISFTGIFWRILTSSLVTTYFQTHFICSHSVHRHFSRRRFHYRERAMNRIRVEQEQIFVNKRAILLPQRHDVRNYELMPEKTFDDEDDEDEDDDEDEVRQLRQRYSRGGDNQRRGQFQDDDDDHLDRQSRRRAPRTAGDHIRRRYEERLDEGDDDDDNFELDPLPKRNSIKDYY